MKPVIGLALAAVACAGTAAGVSLVPPPGPAPSIAVAEIAPGIVVEFVVLPPDDGPLLAAVPRAVVLEPTSTATEVTDVASSPGVAERPASADPVVPLVTTWVPSAAPLAALAVAKRLMRRPTPAEAVWRR